MPLLRLVIGSTIEVELAFTDAEGLPTEATGVTVQARSPSGELRSLTVSSRGTGLYRAHLLADHAGEWWLRAACTGPQPQAVEARALIEPSLVIP